MPKSQLTQEVSWWDEELVVEENTESGVFAGGWRRCSRRWEDRLLLAAEDAGAPPDVNQPDAFSLSGRGEHGVDVWGRARLLEEARDSASMLACFSAGAGAIGSVGANYWTGCQRLAVCVKVVELFKRQAIKSTTTPIQKVQTFNDFGVICG